MGMGIWHIGMNQSHDLVLNLDVSICSNSTSPSHARTQYLAGTRVFDRFGIIL